MSGRPAQQRVQGLANELTAVAERIGLRFARTEPRRRAAGYIRALLGDAERKNGWSWPGGGSSGRSTLASRPGG